MSNHFVAILTRVVERGQYFLSAMEEKINILWSEGRLTDTERENLLALARQSADPDYIEVKTIEERLTTLVDLRDSDYQGREGIPGSTRRPESPG